MQPEPQTLPSITHVIALKSEGVASEFGPMLWAVLAEVSSFYNLDQTRARFDRKWIGDPARFSFGTAEPGQIVDGKLDEKWWLALQSTPKLVDQERLAQEVRKLIPTEGSLVVVTDEEIIPPPEWRYIIWERFDDGDAVASIAPLDPKYWGDPDPDRVNSVKRRIRAALLGITGGMLGFDECDNTRCFLYKDVDSVSVLDNMIALGQEHDAPGLTDKVFSGRIDETLGLEAIDEMPAASLEYEP